MILFPWDSPGKNTGMGCHALLQGIFPTQGSNLHFLQQQVGSLLPVSPGRPRWDMVLWKISLGRSHLIWEQRIIGSEHVKDEEKANKAGRVKISRPWCKRSFVIFKKWKWDYGNEFEIYSKCSTRCNAGKWNDLIYMFKRLLWLFYDKWLGKS